MKFDIGILLEKLSNFGNILRNISHTKMVNYSAIQPRFKLLGEYNLPLIIYIPSQANRRNKKLGRSS